MRSAITISLPADLLAQIDAAAGNACMTRSAWIQTAVKQRLSVIPISVTQAAAEISVTAAEISVTQASEISVIQTEIEWDRDRYANPTVQLFCEQGLLPEPAEGELWPDLSGLAVV